MAVRQGLSLVQYICLRGDLMRGAERWPVGAIVAQACHAATAVLHLFKEDPNVVEYFSDVDRMHKVVLEVRRLRNSQNAFVAIQCSLILSVYITTLR